MKRELNFVLIINDDKPFQPNKNDQYPYSIIKSG